MALFGGKKKEEAKQEKPATKKTATKEVVVEATGVQPERVLLKPYISEKAFLAGERNVYVFEIAHDATKRDVARAIKIAYNVEPVKVRTAKLPGKVASHRMPGRPGMRKGTKKAYVYLKEGDKLSLV